MTPPTDSESIRQWLRSSGIIDLPQGESVFQALANLPLSEEVFATLWERLPSTLNSLSDALGSFRALRLYFEQAVAELDQQSELVNNSSRLTKLLNAFDLGSEVQDWLIEHGVPLSDLQSLPPVDQFASLIKDAINNVADDVGRSSAVRNLIHFQRSAYIDIALCQIDSDEPIEISLQRFSILADAIIGWCYDRCYNQLLHKFGQPCREDRQTARCSILAALELGAQELNLNTPITLMMLADCNGKTKASRSIPNRQFFERLGHDLEEMISSSEPRYRLYPMRWTMIPQLSNSMVQEYDAVSQYYDSKGRTWERQASIQLRTIAGDKGAGDAMIGSLYPWIYRRYIVEADQAGVAVLTRKILRQLSGREYLRWDDSNPAQGVALISKTVHLLLLTYGQQNDALRTLNTFDAIESLHKHKKLNQQQAASLRENLQAFDRLVLETHLDKHPGKEGRFHHRRQLSAKAFEATRNTLFDILLDEQPKASWPAEVSDLIMDPSPPKAWVAHVLREYQLEDPQLAYDLLSQMGEEDVFCLSTRQCRYQFAQIAPALLTMVSSTPSPLSTLHSLNRITQSLGGKAVLWRLFNTTPSTMKAMVRLAASSPYLTTQLTQSPGMIDELVDSLLLGRLPSQREIHDTLGKLASSEVTTQTIAEYKRAFMLRIGIRQLLNKSDARLTRQALSDVADAIITRMAGSFWTKSKSNPSSGRQTSLTSRYAIFAIGQYGARNLNFRDELQLLLVYDDEESESITDTSLMSQHVFDKFGQSMLHQIQSTVRGERIYETRFRWGPLQGRSQLAVGKRDFASLFAAASIMDRFEVLTLRPIVGDMNFAHSVLRFATKLWTPNDWIAILETLKESRESFHSAGVRQGVNLDERLLEVNDLLLRIQAFSNTDIPASESLISLEQEVRQFAIAVHLSCKSSTNELRKDPEARRRLAYFLGEPEWSGVVERIDRIENGALKALDDFLSTAEHRLRMPVSQTGSLDSSPFA